MNDPGNYPIPIYRFTRRSGERDCTVRVYDGRDHFSKHVFMSCACGGKIENINKILFEGALKVYVNLKTIQM